MLIEEFYFHVREIRNSFVNMHRVNLAVREPRLHFFCYFFIYLFLFLFYLCIFLSANVVTKISPLKKKKEKKTFCIPCIFFFSEKCCYFTRSTEGSVFFVCLFFCFSVCLLLFYFSASFKCLTKSPFLAENDILENHKIV